MSVYHVCSNGDNCQYAHLCYHSEPHKKLRACETTHHCIKSVSCIEYKLRFKTEDFLEGMFPVLKKEI